MKLYYTPGACSLSCRIVLHEAGVDCEYESVDLRTKKTASGKNYLDINVKGAVPTLQLDNGQILTENAVIQQYIADTQKASQLLPPIGDLNRYRVLEWLNYITTELHKGLGIFFGPLSDDVKDKLRPLVEKKLDFVNQHLQDKSFVYGNHFTLADAYLFVMISWLPTLKFNANKWPNLTKYFSNLKKRPSIATSLQEENLSPALA